VGVVDIAEAASIEHVMLISADREFTSIVNGGIALTGRDFVRYGMLFVNSGVGIDGRVVGNKAFLGAARTNQGIKRPDGFRYSNQLVSNGRWGDTAAMAPPRSIR